MSCFLSILFFMLFDESWLVFHYTHAPSPQTQCASTFQLPLPSGVVCDCRPEQKQQRWYSTSRPRPWNHLQDPLFSLVTRVLTLCRGWEALEDGRSIS